MLDFSKTGSNVVGRKDRKWSKKGQKLIQKHF